MYRYQALTVKLHNGKTYWQSSCDTLEEAREKSRKTMRKPSDVYIYKIPKNDDENIELIKTILYYGEL